MYSFLVYNETKKMKRKFEPVIDLTNDDEDHAKKEEAGKYEGIRKEFTRHPLRNVESREYGPPKKSHEAIWKPFYLNSLRGIDEADNIGCLSFSDLLWCDQDNPITDIILMNYMMDIEWMIDQAPILADTTVLCLHGSTVQRDPRATNWIISKVDMGIERYGTHHSKMIIAFFQSGIRIVITTGNFIPADFHYITQGTFVQDFPLKSSSTSSDISNSTDFEDSLKEYLSRVSAFGSAANNRLQELTARLSLYDYRSAEVILVPSVPGRHSSSNSINKWGIGKLHYCLQEYDLLAHDNDSSSNSSNTETRLVMQYSSLGSMGKDGKYLEDLAREMFTDTNHSSNLFFSPSPPPQKKKGSDVMRPSIEVVWPTVQTVRESLLGYEAGNSLPCSAKNLYDLNHHHTISTSQPPPLVKAFQHRLKQWDGSISGRKYSTPHLKSYFRYRLLTSEEEAEAIAGQHQNVELLWFVLTSANLSQAAWGVYQSNHKQLYIKSYEMGVLFIPARMRSIGRSYSCTPSHPLLGLSLSSSSSSTDLGSVASTTRFLASCQSPSFLQLDHTIARAVIFFPIPYRVPARDYELGKDYPWVWDVPFHIPDRHGRVKDG